MDSDTEDAKPDPKKEKSLNEYVPSPDPRPFLKGLGSFTWIATGPSDLYITSDRLLTSTLVDIYVGPDSNHWPLHERLLCYHSPFLSRIFYDEKARPTRPGAKKSYGLPDEDELPFELLVGWLYSRQIPMPKNEKELGTLLDLYLLADKLEMERLALDVVDKVADWYHASNTYPGLRRVQYIYANTKEDNAMREMMVSSVARQLATAEAIPMYWATALRRNGQLAVDIIRSIQQWRIEEGSIPDSRTGSRSSERGRGGGGFSVVVEERGESMDAAGTGETDLGVKNLGGVGSGEKEKGKVKQ